MKNLFLSLYKSSKVAMETSKEDLKLSEKMVFLLILALFQKQDQVTIYDIKKANLGINERTTDRLIRQLINKGYLTKQRSNQYFSRTYLTVTDKGLLLARSFRMALASLRSLG